MSGARRVPRVGIFGGSFDPVHNAHLALAHAALAAFRLDQVRWIPAGRPWQKQAQPGKAPMTDAVNRQAMVQLAIDGEPRFVLDPIEIERAGLSYTLDTVRALRARQPATEWFLIIGHDQYAGLHTWHDWRVLLGLVTLGVANRPDTPAVADRPGMPAVARRPGPQRVPDAAVQAFAHRAVPLPMLDISSTDVRRRVNVGQDISQLVPPQVARYIDQHQLYRAAEQ